MEWLRGRYSSTGRWAIMLIGGVSLLLVGVAVIGPARVVSRGRQAIFGEKPRPVLESLRGQPAVTLAPPALVLKREYEGAESGDVVVTRVYSYFGPSDPEAIFRFYRETLPSFGWRPEPENWEGRELYLKTVSGKQVRYVVRADDQGASTEMWTLYDLGLIGG